MRKFLSLFFVVLLVSSLVKPESARAELPVKARAFASIVGYGTAGGALLGAASMAFGTSTRAVAQGASLGLYAGILFGAYVLVAHHNKRMGSYDDNSSPYKDSSDIYGDEYKEDEGGGGDGPQEDAGNFMTRHQLLESKFAPNKKGGNIPPLQINFLQLNF